MLRTISFLLFQLISIVLIAIAVIGEYLSTRNMGVYRYLVAFNHRHQQYLFTSENQLGLGLMALLLLAIFLWLLFCAIRSHESWLLKLTLCHGVIASTGLLIFLLVPVVHSWHSRHLFLYVWSIIAWFVLAEYWILCRIKLNLSK